MNTDTFSLGDKGESVVRFGLEEIYKNVRPTPKDINMQLEWADMVCAGYKQIGFEHIKYEVKTEKDYTGNFFFETFSNVHTQRPGWAVTSTADEVFYLFWESSKGYRLKNFQHLKWHFDYCLGDFKEVDQRRHPQANLTRGRLVPIDWVQNTYCGCVEFDFSRIKARMGHD